MKKVALFTALLLCLFTAKTMAQELETQVKVTDVRSSKGNIIINIFKDEKSYLDQQPFKKIVFDKKSLANGTLHLTFRIAAGTYGITLLDDENSNGKIDKNFIGIPKEGFGFANFYMSGLFKPTFDDFKVVLKSSPNNIEIKIKYM